MACYYHIKLPGGGEAKILASTTAITDLDPSILAGVEEEIKIYYSNKTELTAESPLIVELSKTSLKLTFEQLRSVINKSVSSNLLKNLNEANILINGDISKLTDALWGNLKTNKVSYLPYKGTTYRDISVSDFLNYLNKPIGKRYFNALNSENILNIQSPFDVIMEIENSLTNLEELGIDQDPGNALKRILNTLYQGDAKFGKNFFALEFEGDVHDAVVVKAEDTNRTLIFYNGLNDMSLFMGLFKSLASNIDDAALLNILTLYNQTSKTPINLEGLTAQKFFTGEFVADKDNLTFVDPEFNKLFKEKVTAEGVIALLIEEILPDITGNLTTQQQLRHSFTTLFKFMNPSKYGKGINQDPVILAQTSAEEIKRNEELTILLRTKQLLPLIKKENRDYYYSRRVESEAFTTAEDMYSYLTNNVALHKDLIVIKQKMGNDLLDRSVVPMSFDIRDTGIFIKGFYEENGKRIVISGMVNINAPISHRKLMSREVLIETINAERISPEESITIEASPNSFLPEELVRTSAIRGSAVTFPTTKKPYTNTVKGSYPGVLVGNSSVTPAGTLISDPHISLAKITKIVTDRRLFTDSFTDSDIETKKNILDDYEKISISNSYLPIAESDYILSEDPNLGLIYNKVIAVTDKEVYILIKSISKVANIANNYAVKPILKKDVKVLYKKSISFDKDTVVGVGKFHDALLNDFSINDYPYSSVNNYESAANGDYIVVSIMDGDKVKPNSYNIYKIIDKDKKEVISFKIDSNLVLKPTYSILPENLSNYTIVTNRDIYSDNAAHIAELNSVHITTVEKINKPDNVTYKKVRYVIPENTNVNELVLLDSGNLIRGLLVKDNKIPEGFKDVTEDLIKILNNKRKKSGTELFMLTKGDFWVRHNASLYQTDFTIDKEKFLDTNAFVTLKNPNNPDKSGNKMYRVTGRSKNILTLEFATFNHKGKLTSIHKTLDLDKEIGTIKWLYVMHGSKYEKELIPIVKDNAISNKENKQKTPIEVAIERKQTIDSIAKTFSKIFKIPVLVEPHPERKDKKAWIQTDPDNGEQIVLNSDSETMNTTDVVHEYLHLFLIALRYNGTNSEYEKLMVNYNEYKKLNTTDWAIIEEQFVQDVVDKMEQDFNIVNYETFLAAFNKSLEILQLDSVEFDSTNIFSLLKSPMSTIFRNMKSDISKNNLILFDTNFKEWLSENINNSKIEVLCQ